MAALNAARVIRRVRQRLDLSQEALSRLLNATKGAVQHWERGRNNPDLARLLALRQLCPPSSERKELDALVRQVQSEVAPLPGGPSSLAKKLAGVGRGATQLAPGYSDAGLALVRRENVRLRRQVARIQSTLERRNEQLRILEDLATQLQREIAELRADLPGKARGSRGTVASAME